MTKEIWKDIPGYEGLYRVSNQGNVKSLDRVDSIGRKIKGSILKPSDDGNGYFKVSLSKNNNKKTIKIHQLVAMAFLGHVPCGYKSVVDHKDNDSMNNNLNNLQIITSRENSSKDKKGGSSKYVGVGWNKNAKKWRSRIRINGNQKYLGYFEDEVDAHNAYLEALNKFF